MFTQFGTDFTNKIIDITVKINIPDIITNAILQSIFLGARFDSEHVDYSVFEHIILKFVLPQRLWELLYG